MTSKEENLKTVVPMTSKNSASACAQIWTTCTILGRRQRGMGMQDENDRNLTYGQPETFIQR